MTSAATSPKKKRAEKRSSTNPSIHQSIDPPVPFPIVGIGASAGGLEAFTELLKHLPLDTGMGFVLVQHLDPAHRSALTELLAKATSLPVREVVNDLPVEPNHVYVIPPNTNLAIANGVLKLAPRPQTGAQRSIDFFFESLAQDQQECAVGVILSGTATDGTLGLEAIKGEGGITFAQDESAKFDSMPRNAVAAGCVDFVLSPKKIATELARIARHPYVAGGARTASSASLEGPAEEAERSSGDEPILPSRGRGRPRSEIQDTAPYSKPAEDGLEKILLLLCNHSSVDFSLYKSTTIERRIHRRMVLNKLTSLQAYAKFLRENATELDALYSDVLISVTSFFRNSEAFEILKRKVFPRLVSDRREDSLRVWVLGCSTGQEAYSLAMAYTEFSDQVPRAHELQMFATDLNEALLAKARVGLYAKTLVADVSPERLRRFFTEEDGSYRICKPLRDAVVFARQNVLSDPPFSRMDLITCRNLLIYIEPSLQKKVLRTFHYALKPKGCLFLGASESIGTFTDLFEPVDKKHKIYFKKAGPAPALHMHLGPGHPTHSGPAMVQGSAPYPVGRVRGEGTPEGFHSEINAQREADRIALNRYAPTSVLVNAECQVLQFRGDTSPYLKPPSGQASFNVLKMAREGLMLPLRGAFNKAKKQHKVVRRENVRLSQNGHIRAANIEVVPLKNVKEPCYLIFFEPAQKFTEANKGNKKEVSSFPSVKESRRVTELERDLSETRDYLESMQEQYAAAHEELQAANEEVTSANEELQSANEELETSKEELESTNEELTTVNEEMFRRNADLGRLNNDLTNFQSAANMAILLLGSDLTIHRYTARATKEFNLLPTDVGRPIRGIRHNLDIDDLEELVSEVMATTQEREREVQDKKGHWYSLRVRPYLSLERKLEGAVVVLQDIDALKRNAQEIAEAREYAEAIVRTARDLLLVLNPDLRVHSANEAFYDTFQTSPTETEGRLIYELGGGQWDLPELRKLLEEIIPRNTFFTGYEVTHDFDSLGRRTMLLNARVLSDPSGQPRRILLGIHDITERLEAEAKLKRSELRYRRLFEAARDGVLILDPQTRKIIDANPFMTELLGYTREELLGKELFEIGVLRDRPATQALFQELQEHGCVRCEDLALQAKPGLRRQVEMVSNLYAEAEEQIIQCNLRDITERKQGEEALRQAQAQLADRAGQLELAVTQRTAELTATNTQLEAFAYSIAHDLRAPLRAMRGFTTLLVEEVGGALSAMGRDFAERIDRSAQFMDELLMDLLDFSRLGQERIELVSLNLETVVQTALSRLEKEIRERNARVEIFGPWPTVLAHEPTLGQVLFNLISNALKFITPDVGPLVRLHAEERHEGISGLMDKWINGDVASSNNPTIHSSTNPPPRRPPAAWVRVWVEDNGIGIAPEHQEQIFRLFTRLHGEKYSGTGVGLPIVQKGVERMGGAVGVESTPGQGSRFWFELQKA